MLEPMPVANALRFAAAARGLAAEARARGLVVPGFRSPPRLPGAHRSLAHHDGGAVVSVVLRGRPMVDVAADMVEGVLAANGLGAAEADALRGELLASALGAGATRAA